MRRLPLLPTLLLFAPACGDDITGPDAPAFEPRCGEDGPIQLFPLPDRDLHFAHLQALTSDRLLYAIRYEDDDTQLWSVGRCGEEPELLLEAQLDIPDLVTLPTSPWPDLPFACPADSHTRFAIDPEGQHPPHPTFAAGNCAFAHDSSGIVTVLGEAGSGTLIFQPWPDDPFADTAEQIVLLEGVQTSPNLFEPGFGAGVVYAAAGGLALAVTATDELTAVRLDDLTVEVLSSEVRSFTVSKDGRWIMYEALAGGLYLFDHELDTSTHLATTALTDMRASDPMRFDLIGLLYYGVETESGTEHHYLRTPDLSEFEAPGRPQQVIDAHRGLVHAIGYAVLDATTGESTPMPEIPALFTGKTDSEGITVLHGDGRLEHFDYDGNRELLATSATDSWTRADNGQLFTLIEANDAAPLVAVDPQTLDARYVDDDVHPRSLDSFVENDAAVVSYLVTDPQRRGVWLAQPVVSEP